MVYLLDTNIIIRFLVGDNGIGIAKDKIKNIFEAYNKGDDENRSKFNQNGVGLGLNNCKKIAQ